MKSVNSRNRELAVESRGSTGNEGAGEHPLGNNHGPILCTGYDITLALLESFETRSYDLFRRLCICGRALSGTSCDLMKVRGGWAGTKRQDLHIALATFDGQCFAEIEHKGLGGRVDGEVRHSLKRGGRCNIDDSS